VGSYISARAPVKLVDRSVAGVLLITSVKLLAR